MGGYQPGDLIAHRFNPDLGVGRVLAVEGRMLVVEFPAAETTLRLAAASDALTRVEPTVGAGARLPERDAPLARLARGDVDPHEDFANRLDGLHLGRRREADGLGSFLGGRIRLYPHQLHVAERATRADPVRWLLADEVGLGKTVEACLILQRLVHTGRAGRVLIIAPATLVVQWLGELWRKHHQVFTLLDEPRLADVARDFGAGFNPFDAHRRVIVALETLMAQPRLVAHAVAAGIDLVVVDEAHRLRRPPGHPGDPAWRAVAPLAELGRHLLLLTATPLEEDVHGFHRLLQLLRPAEFPEDGDFDARLASGTPLPPCTSATRRVDIGGLPPRAHRPVEFEAAGAWDATLALEPMILAAPATHAVARAMRRERLARALSGGEALLPLLRPEEVELRAATRAAAASDPRVDWLVAQTRPWRAARDKTLVFVAQRDTLIFLKGAVERLTGQRVAVFHEDLSPGQRDIEVAQFRLPGGPTILISTECGGEGRNFEFCARLVLFDLPWNPAAVEQRIGRLDRIGRTRPVEIVTFRPPHGLGREIEQLYTAIGLFREPLGGVERELAEVQAGIEAAIDDRHADSEGEAGAADGIDPERLAGLVARVGAARTRVREAAWHELHREPFRPELGPGLLARVPADLETLTEEVVRAACERYGFEAEPGRGRRVWGFEFSTRALIDHLPGVPAGSRYLGTFDRETAVEDEGLDFFASGHPLVEGVLAELEDSPRGRVALLDVDLPEVPAGPERIGLLVIFREGARLEAVALDAEGRPRPDWARRLLTRPLRTRRVTPDAWTARPDWTARIEGLAARLDDAARPMAVAAFRIPAVYGTPAPGGPTPPDGGRGSIA